MRKQVQCQQNSENRVFLLVPPGGILRNFAKDNNDPTEQRVHPVEDDDEFRVPVGGQLENSGHCPDDHQNWHHQHGNIANGHVLEEKVNDVVAVGDDDGYAAYEVQEGHSCSEERMNCDSIAIIFEENAPDEKVLDPNAGYCEHNPMHGLPLLFDGSADKIFLF